jgi:hypothetical protein
MSRSRLWILNSAGRYRDSAPSLGSALYGLILDRTHSASSSRLNSPAASRTMTRSCSSTPAMSSFPLRTRNISIAKCPTRLLPSRNGWLHTSENPRAAAFVGRHGYRSCPPTSFAVERPLIQAQRDPAPLRAHQSAAAQGDEAPKAPQATNAESCEPPIQLCILLEQMIHRFLKLLIRAIE